MQKISWLGLINNLIRNSQSIFTTGRHYSTSRQGTEGFFSSLFKILSNKIQCLASITRIATRRIEWMDTSIFIIKMVLTLYSKIWSITTLDKMGKFKAGTCKISVINQRFLATAEESNLRIKVKGRSLGKGFKPWEVELPGQPLEIIWISLKSSGTTSIIG